MAVKFNEKGDLIVVEGPKQSVALIWYEKFRGCLLLFLKTVFLIFFNYFFFFWNENDENMFEKHVKSYFKNLFSKKYILKYLFYFFKKSYIFCPYFKNTSFYKTKIIPTCSILQAPFLKARLVI